MSARFVGQFRKFGEELFRTRTVRPTGLHEHLFRPPKKYAVDGFGRLIAQKRALVAHPQRFLVAAA